jgi:bacterioferritin-associated ferredoxin
MYVCLCHPFSDKKVKKHLDEKGSRANVSETYRACSGGENPNCCQCLETLKDIVKTHNKTVAA